jgi:hypothetical protein
LERQVRHVLRIFGPGFKRTTSCTCFGKIRSRFLVKRGDPMIWLKRRFHGADYAPYQDLVEKLVLRMPTRNAEFIMVRADTEEDPLVSTYYVGLPDGTPTGQFDGFERVDESIFPIEVDTCLVSGDEAEELFVSQIKFKQRR